MINEEKIFGKIITEELGVLDEVGNWTHKIANDVILNYKPNSKYEYYFTPFEAEKSYVVIFEFEDYEKISQVPENKEDYRGVTYFNEHFIYINGYTIKGKILKDKLNEVLQHELHHVFEMHLSQKDKILTNKNFDIYKIAVKEAKIVPTGELLSIRRDIGYAVYLSFKFETNAFENGTYAFLMKQDLKYMGDELNAVKKTMYYKRFLKVKNAYDFILNYPKETQEIAEHIYFKSSKWLKRIVSMSLKSCRRQLSRAIAKVRKDYDYTHGGNSSVTV